MENSNHELTITRRFSAPVGKLYHACHAPEYIRRWHAPGAMTVPEISVDFRVGGRYRVVMQNSGNDDRHVVSGEYLEIVENTLMRFSWQWEGSPVHTEVEMRFCATPTGSELQLRHRQFTDDDMRNRHNQGWTGSLDKLAQILESEEGVAA